jgi:hypothetical protein
MSNTSIKIFDKKKFAIAFGICLILGFFPAFIVSRETSGYVAGMTHGILIIFFGLPFLVFAFILVLAAALKNNAQYSIIFLMGLFLVPVSFVVSLKLMEFTKIARYKQVSEEIRPFENDSTNGLTVVFKKDVSFDVVQKFTNETFFPWNSAVGFTHESGVCSSSSSPDINNHRIEIFFFCNATEDQKQKLREKLRFSEIVYKFYENIKIEDIKGLS